MKESRFKPKEQVLFIFSYGDVDDKGHAEYNEIAIGEIDKIEYIENRDKFLYCIHYNAGYTMLGEHMIFKLDEYDKAEKELKEI